MNILLIKLGALGDVLRTTPLLPALKDQYKSARITWLVDAACRDVLEANPLIDELLSYSAGNVSELSRRHFDLLINLDKEEEALSAAMGVPASKKMGFGRTPAGVLGPFDISSDYAYRLGVDDELKFKKNQKSYQEISFEQAGLSFRGEEYVFSVDEDSRSFIREHLRGLGVDWKRIRRPIVGLNTGSGSRFAGKCLPVATLVELARKLTEELPATVFLLGGRDEITRNLEIERSSRVPLVNTGSHVIRRFAAIVGECDLVISGDTTAMHIAIAVKVPVLVHFGSTCAQEIELYGRGEKIVSDIDCAPCYKRICPIGEQCMKDMGARQLFEAAKELLEKRFLNERHRVH